MASILNAGQQGLNFSRSSASSSPLIQPNSALGKVLSVVDLTRIPSLQEADRTTVVFTVLAVIATLLLAEQYNYQKKKAHLPGPKWTIPIIGKFADSLNPSLEKYQEGWNSGPLSVASVFNMYVFAVCLGAATVWYRLSSLTPRLINSTVSSRLASASASAALSSLLRPTSMPAKSSTALLTPSHASLLLLRRCFARTTGECLHLGSPSTAGVL